MMATDPVVSAIDALVAHLQAEIDTSGLPAEFQTLTVRRGWPEHNTELDMSDGPVIAVSAGEPSETRITPRPVGTEDAGGGVLTTTYKVAESEFPLQVDAWSPYRAVRDALVPALEAALINQLPSSGGLWLTSTGYYGRPLSFELKSGPRYDDDSDGVARAEWRAIWSMTCTTDKVVQTPHPTLVDLDATITTTEGDTGASVSESFDLANT